MKRAFLTAMILLTALTINSFPSNGEKNYSIIEIVTPANLIYDDGIYRTKFSAFYVVDANGNKVLSSGEVFDTAAMVKLPEGSYKICYYSLNEKLLEKEIAVPKGNFSRIILE
ncbi:hypothetical protein [Melioribacter sp. OK-6-Me]|uniref:hypothetical protein n=1 Tax=unclassified Melioribacter TaxID=2627329 RepID=UPI003ED9E9F7